MASVIINKGEMWYNQPEDEGDIRGTKARGIPGSVVQDSTFNRAIDKVYCCRWQDWEAVTSV